MAPQLHWPSLLRQLHALEQSWNAHKVHYPREDAVPFLPFPIPRFITMLADAVMAAPTRWSASAQEHGAVVPTFIDVGCGPGTKIRLAEQMFGLDGYGIDIVPAFVAEAQSCGVKAGLIDAFEFNSYDAFDIVFANRPSTQQDELEKLICGAMRDGAVLMGANWRHQPAEFGLEPVAVEYGRPVCGVWRKPVG